jgi:hypothetical protein
MADQTITPPVLMVTDGNPTYPIAVREMQRENKLPESCKLRCSHSENNLIEQDHRAAFSGGLMRNNIFDPSGRWPGCSGRLLSGG